MDDNNEKRVPVYTNVPIGNDDIDYVGLKTYANHIDAALRKSNTIGVIGDFGTGKSSLIEYLKNNRLKDRYQVAPINLWNVNKETSNRNVDVHIHFLYQLALCLTSQRFAKSINRRVNRNYGFFSFNMNIFSCVFLIIAILLYLCYVVLKPEDITWLECILDATKAGVLLCLSIFCLIIGVLRANITVSSGKNENQREVNFNEIVEVYKDILNYSRYKGFLKKPWSWCKRKGVVIVIEDLDRSSDSAQAYSFLQELNKYYINCLDAKERETIKFIVNIRPETDFIGAKESLIYTKVFDYTVNLFPINASNYDVVLDNLLNEQKEYLERIGINVFPEKNTQKIPGMKRLVYGKQITFRDVKERLNCALLIYNALCCNITDELRKRNVKFEKCAFVAYLRNTYPVEYLEIYKNSKLENVIFDYIINNKDSDYDLKDALTNTLPDANTHFIDDLKNGIKERIVDTDYKMYFYNYPKDAYVRSLSEAIVYDTIMYDEEYSSNFDVSLNEAIMLDKDIIASVYEERRSLTNVLPRVTFRNGLLFEHCIKNYRKDTFDNLKSLLDFDNKTINRSKIVLENLFSLKLRQLNWDELISEYREELKTVFVEKLENVLENNILIIRSTILDFFAEQIQDFDYLFSETYPPIRCEEIKKISNINIGLSLSLLQPVELETVMALPESVMGDILESETVELVNTLYDNIAESIQDNEDVGAMFAEFSEKVERLSYKRELYVFELAENNVTFKEIYIRMLNDTNGAGVDEKTILEHIKKLNIMKGLEIALADKILRGKENQLFIRNLLAASYDINNILEYKDILKEEISAIYDAEGGIIDKLRNKVLNAAKKNRGILEELDFVFKSPMQIISENELLSVSSIVDALRIIDCNQVDLNNCKYIAEYINRKGVAHPGSVNKVLMFIAEINEDVAKPFFQLLDFNKIAYEAVSISKRKKFVETIEDNFKLVSDKLEIIRFLKQINYLEKELEKRLVGGFTEEENKEYRLLLDKVDEDEIDEVTIDVLDTSGYYSIHNTGVQRKLYDYKQYGRYIYARTKMTGKFDFEKDNPNITSEVYLKLLKNNNIKSIHTIMFENAEFREYAIEEKMYLDLDDEMLFYFAKGRQTQDIIEYIFTKEESLIMKYLSEIVAIADSETEEFLLNKMTENSKILVDKAVYKNVKNCMMDLAIKSKYKNKRDYRKRKGIN